MKRKYKIGKEYKGIKRFKGDDQPGRVTKANNGSTHVIPQRGAKYRVPTGAPGSPQGKPIKGRAE